MAKKEKKEPVEKLLSKCIENSLILISDSHISAAVNNNDEKNLYTASLSNFNSSILSSSTSSLQVSRKRTNRSLIVELERMILNDGRSPSKIKSLEDLSSRLLTWDKKLSSTMTKQSDDIKSSESYKKVNIIGCLHPVELILAKADRRIKRQNQHMYVIE